MKLGLDIGQNLAYFKGDAVGPVEWGTFEMPKTRDLGRWLLASDGPLRKILPGVDEVGVEKPFMGQDISPAIRLFCQMGHVAYWGSFYGIGWSNFHMVQNATGKLALSGAGNADADQMIDGAERHGYFGLNVHEAHACGVWKVVTFGAPETQEQRRKRERQARRTTTP